MATKVTSNQISSSTAARAEMEQQVNDLLGSKVGESPRLLDPNALNLTEISPFNFLNLTLLYSGALPTLPKVTNVSDLITRLKQFRDILLTTSKYPDPTGEILRQFPVTSLDIHYDDASKNNAQGLFRSADEILQNTLQGTTCTGMANLQGVVYKSFKVPSLIVGSLGPGDNHARLLFLRDGIWQILNVQAYPQEELIKNNILTTYSLGHIASLSTPLFAHTPEAAARSMIPTAKRFIIWDPDPKYPKFSDAFNDSVYNSLRGALFAGGVRGGILALPQAEMPLFFERGFGWLFNRKQYEIQVSGSSLEGTLWAGMPAGKKDEWYIEGGAAGGPNSGTRTGLSLNHQWMNPLGASGLALNIGLKAMVASGPHYNEQEAGYLKGTLHTLLLAEAGFLKIFRSEITLYNHATFGLSLYNFNTNGSNVPAPVFSTTTGATFPIMRKQFGRIDSFVETAVLFGSPGTGNENSDWLLEVLWRAGLNASFPLTSALSLHLKTIFPAAEISSYFASGPKGPYGFTYLQQNAGLHYQTSSLSLKLDAHAAGLINFNPNNGVTTFDLGGIYGPGSAAGGQLAASYLLTPRLLVEGAADTGIKKDRSFYSQEVLALKALFWGGRVTLGGELFHNLQTGVSAEVDSASGATNLFPNFGALRHQAGGRLLIEIKR